MLPDIETLQQRLHKLIPDQYQVREAAVSFAPMRSAGLRFNADGAVAWDKIWSSFCDLALAGGPPHKGNLLQPASAEEITKAPRAYRQVVDEICRGIALVTGLDAEPSIPGWVRVSCTSSAMAAWLLRAITMENVSVTCDGSTLCLPAGPAYRLDKQIKNVVTVMAKTFHYWRDHMPPAQHWAISDLFTTMEAEQPLIAPDLTQRDTPAQIIGLNIQQQTGLVPFSTSLKYPGWLGIACSSASEALRFAQLLLTSNILARREESTLFVPLHPKADPSADAVIRALTGIAQPEASGKVD